MAEREETTVYRYVGECPECGTKQEAQYESQVDRVCDECRKTIATAEFMKKIAFLRGAEILDFKGECKLNYDGSLGSCDISELTISTSDRRILRITTSRGLWRAVEQ